MESSTHGPAVQPDSRLGTGRLARSIVAGAGGRRVLRLLVPGACRFECKRCPFADSLGAGWEDPLALGRQILTLYRRGRCDGVYLTAGLPADPDGAASRILALAEVLRLRLGYRGYLHVKVPPGVAARRAERLVWLADRVSSVPEPPCSAAFVGSGAGARERMDGVPPFSGATSDLVAAQRASALRAPGPLPARKAAPSRPALLRQPSSPPGAATRRRSATSSQLFPQKRLAIVGEVTGRTPVQAELFPGVPIPARGMLRPI